MLNRSTGGSVGQAMVMVVMMMMTIVMMRRMLMEEMWELRIDHLPFEIWAKRKTED